jgi:hypothetical protein
LGELLAGQANGIVQLALQQFLRRQFGQVLGDTDAAGVQSQQANLLL